MKQMEVQTEGGNANLKYAAPLPPPLPRFWVATKPAAVKDNHYSSTVSLTNEEIAKFWRQKRMEEEDHLLAAIKAAARIRARKLRPDDYKRFEEESLKEDNGNDEENNKYTTNLKVENRKESSVGIKDWWKESKYAYLNQLNWPLRRYC